MLQISIDASGNYVIVASPEEHEALTVFLDKIAILGRYEWTPEIDRIRFDLHQTNRIE